MSVIKFRGICKDTGEFVYGNYVHFPNLDWIVAVSTWKEHFFAGSPYASIFLDGSQDIKLRTPCMIFPVEKDSVAQLVGYDTDGKEVYTNDQLYSTETMEIVNAVDVLQIWDFGDTFMNYKLWSHDDE